MKKKASLFFAFTLMTSLMFPSCSSPSASVELWTVDGMQKIMQDGEYARANASTSIRVSGAKNEYEGSQIILSSTGEAASNYTVTASDLKTADGEVYDAENVSFFHQLYVELSPYEYYVDEGYYPDGILPMETAVKYKENIVPAGKNQGIYTEFYIPSEQEAGVYTGNFYVQTKEEQFTVPVSLEVWDFSVSEKTTAKSLFLTRTDYWTGEKDTTQEKYNAYTDALLEYRLCVNDLLLENDHSARCIEEWVELAYKYALNERCSTISVPFKTVYTSQKYLYNGEEMSLGMIFDEEVWKEYIRALAKKCAETGVNILDKCVMYITIIDEPQLNRTLHRVKYVSERLTAIKEEMYQEIIANEDLSEDKISREELAKSMRKIANIVTGYYDKDLDGVEIDYCPNPDQYHTEGMRENFANNERWWYCCISPNNPYPTYHIDDHLLGTRLLYWMAADYKVVGNLNWSVSMYNVDGEMPEDFYKYAMHNSGRNGEGFLFYPGAKYGLDKPVASLRLQAYRDGVEEYEMMQALRDKYQQYGMDAQSIISDLGSAMYFGTQWSTTEENFYNTRKRLAMISEMALSSEKEGLFLSDMKNEGRVFGGKLFALNDTKVQINGVDINSLPYVEKTQKEGGTLYDMSIDKTSFGQRNLTVSATINGQEKSVSYDLGGAISAFEVEEFKDTFKVYNNTKVTFEMTSANGIGEYTDGNLMKFVLEEDGKDAKYSVETTASFLEKLNTNCKEMELVLYADEEVEYEISFLYKKGSMVGGRPIYNLITAGKLSVGENTIKIPNLDSYNWTKYEKVTNMLITFKSSTGKTVYLKEVVLSGV